MHHATVRTSNRIDGDISMRPARCIYATLLRCYPETVLSVRLYVLLAARRCKTVHDQLTGHSLVAGDSPPQHDKRLAWLCCVGCYGAMPAGMYWSALL
jgi:hypothetical protein